MYDATWNLQGALGGAIGSTWKYYFQGGRFDGITGLYNFRNRDYSTTLGGWTEQDPIGYSANGVDLYEFARDDPFAFNDPTGTISVKGGSIGIRQNFVWCFPLPGVPAVSICFVATVEGYYSRCCAKNCVTLFGNGSIGAYISGTLGGRPLKEEISWWAFAPGLNKFTRLFDNVVSAAKTLLSGNFLQGLITVFKGPAGIGRLEFQCPVEGFSVDICATFSTGFSSLSGGVRGCYYYPAGTVTWTAGWGVGQGTGISFGFGFQYTKCW
jgi:RHS repeat-associated protein